MDSDSQRVQFLSQQALEQMHTPLVYDPQTNTTRGLAVQMTEDILDGTHPVGDIRATLTA